MHLKGILLAVLLGTGLIQMVSGQDHTLFVEQSNSPILIDGLLNEKAWQNAHIADNFQMNFPFDSIPARSKTEVRITYDTEFLYISATCEDKVKGDFVVQSLKRDFEFKDNDAFAVYIDAFSEGINGLYFAVNPYGVQSDGLISNGGNKGVTLNWDGLWYAEVNHSTKGVWTLEMAIPFKTLRFDEQDNNWRINFARNDQKRNEISTWVAVPRGFETSTLSSTGQLIWHTRPQEPISNVAIIPYTSVGISKDYEIAESKTKNSADLGMDAKITMNSSLNLDLTINPDFSQVEVDQQVIDLQRFELFFPERRLFFLENSDLFANLGNSRARPFFSRRIGNAGSEEVPILFGARLSGNLNKDWRMGLMSIQTKPVEAIGQKAQNYSVATLQRNILKNSNLTAFLMNRQAFRDFYAYNKDFNRVGGIEMDYRSFDAKWTGKAFLHYSFNPSNLGNHLAYSAKLRYRTTEYSLLLEIDDIGKNYITDIGFVPRLYHANQPADSTFRIGYTQFRADGYYRFFAKKRSKIDFWGPELDASIFTNNNLSFKEHDVDLSWVLQFKNSNRICLSYLDYSINLFYPFKLKGLEESLPEGLYRNQRVFMKFDTGKRKQLFGQLKFGYGKEYLGKLFSLETELNYRYKHLAVIGFTYEHQNLMDFPNEYGQPDFSLLGSKVEISFRRNLFFTTFFQYNTQSNNFNINSRFNWRFQPMSDLYIVYTENYTSHGLLIKNRAVILKLNYWLNL